MQGIIDHQLKHCANSYNYWQTYLGIGCFDNHILVLLDNGTDNHQMRSRMMNHFCMDLGQDTQFLQIYQTVRVVRMHLQDM